MAFIFGSPIRVTELEGNKIIQAKVDAVLYFDNLRTPQVGDPISTGRDRNCKCNQCTERKPAVIYT